jgi:type I site-specific restriction endonuclease
MKDNSSDHITHTFPVASQGSPVREDIPPRASALGDNVGSASEIAEPTFRDPQEQVGASPETMTEQVDVNETRGQGPSPSATGQLELMLAVFVSAIQRDNVLLKESIGPDIRTENGKLLQRFQQRTQELRREFTSQQNAESRRFTDLVSQIQSESTSTSELVAVKRQLQSIGEDFDSRISQASTSTQLVINELADRVQEHQAEVEEELLRLKESLKKFSEAAIHEKSVVERNLGQVNAKVSALEFKFNEQPTRQISAPEARAVVEQVNGHNVEPEGTLGNGGAVGENTSCSCRPAPCTSVVRVV